MKLSALYKGFLVVIATVGTAYLFFQLTLPLLAQDNSSDSGGEQKSCKDEMEIYIATRTKEFGDKIDGLYRGNEQNSGLLSDAMIELRDYRNDLNKKFDDVYFAEKSPTFGERLAVHTECKKIVDEAIEDAQLTFMNVTTVNSQVKKTSRLIEKYRALNQKIKNLAYQFGLMKGQFDALAKRIPYWTVDCLSN